MSTTTIHNQANRIPPHVATSARRAAWAAVGLAAASLLWANAHAQSLANAHAQSLAKEKAVDYSDLNLSVPADATALYTRLQRAAKAVCGTVQATDLRRLLERRACYREALSGAVATVDHASITALHHSNRNSQYAQRPAVVPSRS